MWAAQGLAKPRSPAQVPKPAFTRPGRLGRGPRRRALDEDGPAGGARGAGQRPHGARGAGAQTGTVDLRCARCGACARDGSPPSTRPGPRPLAPGPRGRVQSEPRPFSMYPTRPTSETTSEAPTGPSPTSDSINDHHGFGDSWRPTWCSVSP